MNKIRNGIFIYFFTLILNTSLWAQSTLIGVVQDSIFQKEMPYCSVLLKQNDTLVRGAITSEKGQFSLKNLSKGVYNLEILFTGYKTIKKPIIIKTGYKIIDLGIFKMSIQQRQIGVVTVRGKKNTYKQQLDKTIVTYTEEDSRKYPRLMQALQKTSGLRVTPRTNKIAILGKSNILLLINGVKKSAQEITMLKTSDIKYIEIINNPDASYESTYNAVLNIVTKKNTKMGFALDIDLDAYYPNIYNFSNIKLQYGFSKMKFYAYYKLWMRRSETEYSNDIKYLSNNLITETYDTTHDTQKRLQIEHYANYGADIFLNNNNFINLSGDYTSYSQDIPTKQTIVILQNETKKSEYLWKKSQNFLYSSQNFSLFFKHNLNQKNSLNLSTTYYLTKLNAGDKSRQIASDVDNSLVENNFFRTKNSLYGKLNYGGILKKYSIDAGIYSYIRSIKNQYTFNSLPSIYTNFKETRINTYFHMNTQRKNFEYSFAVALENQYYLVDSIPGTNINFLPSLNFEVNLGNKQTLSAGYNRKITYPSIFQLANFKSTTDSLNFFIGNPKVKAFTRDGIYLKYTYRYNGLFISPDIEYTYVNQPVLSVLNLSSTDKLIHTYDNLGKINQLNFNLISSFSLFDIEFNPTISMFYDKYTMSEGIWQGFYYEINFSPNYTFKNKLTLTANLYYTGKKIIYQGYELSTPSFDFEISKNFLNEELNLAIDVNPFNDYYTRIYKLENSTVSSKEMEHYRNINITLIYSLKRGNKLKQQSKDINTDGDF